MVSFTPPSPPQSPLLRVKHCQFFSPSHLMSFLLLIKVGLEKLCGLCRETRSGRVVSSSNIGRGFKGRGNQNRASKNASIDSGELYRGAQVVQDHVSLSQDFVSSWVSFRREVIWSTPGHSPCIGLRTCCSVGFLCCTLQGSTISVALSSMTQYLFSNFLHSEKHSDFKTSFTFYLPGSLLLPAILDVF